VNQRALIGYDTNSLSPHRPVDTPKDVAEDEFTLIPTTMVAPQGRE